MAIDKKYWDGEKWDGHRAFNTIDHHHVSCFSAAPGHHDCDLMVVECADGRWYVEDNCGDAQGSENVWNPRNRSDASPHFFPSEDEAFKHAAAVIRKISGVTDDRISGIE